MNQFRLKACPKCRGDLVFDEGDWRCLQCGTYYYTGLYRREDALWWPPPDRRDWPLEKAAAGALWPSPCFRGPALETVSIASYRQAGLTAEMVVRVPRVSVAGG